MPLTAAGTTSRDKGAAGFAYRVHLAWKRWFEGADVVSAEFELTSDGPETVRDQNYMVSCFLSAVAHDGVDTRELGHTSGVVRFRIWFRRKIHGRWEDYWFAPR